jgi:hypothetical protein
MRILPIAALCAALAGCAANPGYQQPDPASQAVYASMLMHGMGMMAPPPPRISSAQCTRFGNSVNCAGMNW